MRSTTTLLKTTGFDWKRNINLAQNLAVPPNHSLNRTHCGMRLKARHFILGL